MKELNNELKSICFILLLLVVSLVGCNKNDSNKNFLEDNAGINWKFIESEEILYIRINNNHISPLDIWDFEIGSDCFNKQGIQETGSLGITENSENKLVLRIVNSPTEYTIITMTREGDTLIATNERYLNDILDEKEVFVFNMTSDNLDDLIICTT